MEAIALREMRQEDVPAADALRQLIGWNQTEEDWRRMLRLEPAGCFLALKAGVVVGTVTTISYGTALAWIGMMLVHPEHRRQGIASRLMIRAIDYLRAKGIDCIKLDATPAGKPLYQQLGFVSEWSLTRWQRPQTPAGAAPAATSTRPVQLKDWREVEELDRAAFGTARTQLLRSLDVINCTAHVWPVEGAVKGWGMLRRGANACYLGPLACLSFEGTEALVRSMLSAANGRPIFWDVPDQNEAAKAFARRFDFVPVRPLTRMYLGPNVAPSDLGVLHGIADPALG